MLVMEKAKLRQDDMNVDRLSGGDMNLRSLWRGENVMAPTAMLRMV